MCGVLTWISRRGVDPDRLSAGLAALRHRGPDAAATRVVEVPTGRGGVGVGMAHARLAILDPTPVADQPFRRGGHALCYNGEIYNFREVASGLPGPFETAGDTEVLLSVLAREGLAGLARLRGMWAFAWLDEPGRRLVAARDRYGKKPLFYVADADEVVIASEIGAIEAATGRRFAMREEALATFLVDGWLLPRPDGLTHLAGLRELPPGHALVLDLETWTLSEAPVEGLWPDAPAGDLAETLAQAVADRLVSDRPVGLLLSGGVDSTLILSVLAARGWLDRVTCFIGEAGKSDDAAHARACVTATGARAVEVPLDYGPGSADDFLAVCRRQEKPFPLIGNVLGLPALYRAIAERGVRVVLDGTGADEVFGGYWNRYAGFAMRDAARAGDGAWLAALRAGGMLPEALARLPDAALLDSVLPVPGTPTLPEADLDLLSGAGRGLVGAARPGDPLVGFPGSLGAALGLDSRAGRLQEWLWQNDRNAMAAGVENRSPFLDPRLRAWEATPYHAKFGGAANKRELRALFAAFTPLPTADRLDKQGFRWVYGRFLRANRGFVADLLASSGTVRGLCRMDDLQAALAARDAEDRPLLMRLLVLAGLEAVGAARPA